MSIIVPVYNRPHMLREAVASTLAQTYRPIEVIIVDDGSTDDTSRVAEELATAHPEICLIRQNQGGPGVAREAGRQLAQGEFIQYLDSDDILMPEKFALQVSGLESCPQCDISYGITRYTNGNGKILAAEWKGTGSHISTLFPSMLKERWWGTSTPLYRSSLLTVAGPWLNLVNEEDWEYDCRLASHGVKLNYVASVISEEQGHNSERLSAGGSVEPEKLRDRSIAHQHIFRHALRGGLSPDVPEMQHFARDLFLLTRQCGAAGLEKESRSLFDLARRASGEERGNGRDFRLYGFGAGLIGWKAMGRLSRQLDRIRS